MEWSINDMLKDDITRIDHTLLPPGIKRDVHSDRIIYQNLSREIDALGEMSATAQNLKKVITTAEKLHNSPNHILYLLKNSTGNGGKGELVGLLKVGRKHLYLFDDSDVVREVEPLCVLDFYVRADLQRHGLGRRLFDHMLQEEGVSAEKLAIDGPSPKMEQFLRKNYNINNLIRQNINFAISPKFFSGDGGDLRSGRSTPVISPPGVGRFSATKPPSIIGKVIHGGESSGGYYRENSTTSSRTTTPTPEPKFRLLEPVLCDQPDCTPERPTTLHVETTSLAAPDNNTGNALSPGKERGRACSPARTATPRRDSQLTDQGYFDVKFYHNKLW